MGERNELRGETTAAESKRKEMNDGRRERETTELQIRCNTFTLAWFCFKLIPEFISTLI